MSKKQVAARGAVVEAPEASQKKSTKKVDVMTGEVNKDKEVVLSTKDLARRLGVEYIIAFSLLRLLAKKKVVRPVGKREPEGGRGKKIVLWAIPRGEFSLSLVK